MVAALAAELTPNTTKNTIKGTTFLNVKVFLAMVFNPPGILMLSL
jgi:hypothetical protein